MIQNPDRFFRRGRSPGSFFFSKRFHSGRQQDSSVGLFVPSPREKETSGITPPSFRFYSLSANNPHSIQPDEIASSERAICPIERNCYPTGKVEFLKFIVSRMISAPNGWFLRYVGWHALHALNASLIPPKIFWFFAIFSQDSHTGRKYLLDRFCRPAIMRFTTFLPQPLPIRSK